ncbi:tyrosine-type recombinase/integrase [Bdellovibrionota bacterium FG-1]
MHSNTTEAELRRIQEYLGFLKARGRKDQTIDSYASAHRSISAIISSRTGEPFDLTRVAGLDIRDWKSEQLKAGKATTTINHRLVFLKAYVAWAVQSGVVTRERSESIQAVPELPMTRLGAKTLPQEEFRRFMRNVELTASPRDKAIVYLMLSGLRVSEVAGLRHEDISLSVNRGILEIRGEHVKGSSSRTVPLARQARIQLRAHLGDEFGQGLVFNGERGPLTTDGIYKLVRKLGALVGVKTHDHLLRHHFAMNFLEENPGDLVALQNLLGHSSLETTSRHYVRKRLADLEAGVEKLSM